MNLLNVTVSTEMRCVNLYIYESLKPTDFNSLCMEPFKFYEYQKQMCRMFPARHLMKSKVSGFSEICALFTEPRFWEVI